MKAIFSIIIFLSFLITSCNQQEPEELPNILWIVSEDTSPYLGCYGDTFATTPNLDKLSAEGIRYTHAYANAPVCAPARNTIITGVYASSGGHENMRSNYKKSDIIKFFPVFLREKGYYCTNNHKEDYNIDNEQTKDIWHESSRTAHYRNRNEGQPFFAVFNNNVSHESSIHNWIPEEKLRHKPEDVELPPYHPDTREFRHDWAQYYDKIQDMDAWVGELLKELEESGEAENTIIFYYGDHGGILGRSKRYLYETGTRVPLIIRIPEKYEYLLEGKEPGSTEDRLVSFVDLAPTLLSITGINVPDFMQGKAFLGKQKTKDPEYAYMFRARMDERYDLSRSVRNDRFRYTINYMPFRIYGQHLNYLWKAPSMVSWEEAFNNGHCNEVQSRFFREKQVEELYLTESDPWEINNLADDPEYRDVLLEMRAANSEWIREIKDPGFIPEPIRYELYGDASIYDIVRQDSFQLEEIIKAAEKSTSLNPDDIPEFQSMLKHQNPAIRYWGVVGLLNLKEKAAPAIKDLQEAVNDNSGTVAVLAAETLYRLGEKEGTTETIIRVLNSDNFYLKCFALNTVDILDLNNKDIQNKILELASGIEHENRYDNRMVVQLLDKWGYNRDK